LSFKRKKKRKKLECKAATLNIMPFIDVFSMLNTFLLISAAFASIGILKVQVPFFTNAPPDKTKPTRSITYNLTIEKDKLEFAQRWSMPPDDEVKKEYKNDKDGIENLHRDLIALRQKNPETDLITLFSDDDIRYENVVDVVDAIKTLKENDPTIMAKDEKTGEMTKSRYLYEKIVMGSVIL
jgi:biopolymer transport protein ExbD